MARWKNPLIKSVVLNTLEFPSSERGSSTTGSGRAGIMLCSSIFIVTRQPYTSISFCDDNQGANSIREASPTGKRLVILGANFRGENWRMAVGLLLLRRRVLSLCDDNQGANPIRVDSPTSKRLVILGASFRGENCASGGKASASQASRLIIVRRQPRGQPISSRFAHQQKACNSRCERSRRELRKWR